METVYLEFKKQLATVDSSTALENLKSQYLGRNGVLKKLKSNTDLKTSTTEEKRAFGLMFNELKSQIQLMVEEKQVILEQKPSSNPIDLTLPGIKKAPGRLHPISQVQDDLENICLSMGFKVLGGAEMETDYNNFASLNTPDDHPARDMQDTFWLNNGKLLRTQTSANQVQTLRRYGAPLRAVFPGKCFRYETTDATHENTFYQMEGLVVDENISIANLIAVMKEIISAVFKREVTVRLRPGYFPFVEPAFELDIQCLICHGQGCPGCKKAGWLELLPCGLIHPVVLKNGNIDGEKYTGFAFGLGLTRLAMMKFQIPDIRLFNSGDFRFLEQF
ncbi:phenylalanine--tRNA ligase subunit alpha [bacterium]|nr:phenylalanine--tRNA ligase subunit alpha [bacterium]